MAKKTSKSVKSASKSSSKAKAPDKKPVAKAAKATKPVKNSKPVVASAASKGKKPVAAVKKVEAPASAPQKSKPALMTSRGKVKDAPTMTPVTTKSKVTAAVKPAPEEGDVTAQVKKTFENNGEQLIAMAKDEMSKINRTGDADKSDKPGKFKPIKIERGNLTDEKAKWQELFKRYGKEKATSYKMTDAFESLRPIQHKVLGWGFILSNDNNRLEVLFENGIKMLISNYKPN